jgi:hypothetical protein
VRATKLLSMSLARVLIPVVEGDHDLQYSDDTKELLHLFALFLLFVEEVVVDGTAITAVRAQPVVLFR